MLIPELEIDIKKYWNRYFQYSGIPSIQDFIDNNKLILDYDATIDNNNNITILRINFNDTISKIFPLAVLNLFDQNPKDQQIILFNLLTNVSNLEVVKYEIEKFYNTRIIDIFNQENYVIADFFSLLNDFNKIVPHQTSILQNLLKQIQDDFKKRIFNQNLNRNLISGLKYYERCRFIPYKEFPIEKLLIAMDYYVVTNQNSINDETGEKNSFPVTSFLNNLNEHFKTSTFYDFISILSCSFLFSKIKQFDNNFDLLRTEMTPCFVSKPTSFQDLKEATKFLFNEIVRFTTKSPVLEQKFYLLKLVNEFLSKNE